MCWDPSGQRLAISFKSKKIVIKFSKVKNYLKKIFYKEYESDMHLNVVAIFM